MRGIDRAFWRFEGGIELAGMAADLEGRGRILVRPSGTESLMRVMVEADEEVLDATMAEIILLIQNSQISHKNNTLK